MNTDDQKEMQTEREMTVEASKEEKPVTQNPNPPAKVLSELNQPAEETFDYAGYDSTAVVDIAFVDSPPIKKEVKTLDSWTAQCKEPQPDRSKLIKSGVEFAKKIAKDMNELINFTAKDVAKRAIHLGMIFLQLKEMVKGTETPWTVWADENLHFIGERNREKYMGLAKRKDCYPYAFLGVDRLDMLCSATKDSKEEDPIGAFLKKYEIPFDEQSEDNMTEFRNLIDSALNNEKLLKNGIAVDFPLVKHLTLSKFDFDKSFLKELKHIQESGGSAEARLKKLSMNNGKETDEDDGEKRIQDFNTLSNRLIKTIDYIVKDSNQHAKVDQNTFTKLLEKLAELQKLVNLAAETQASA
jgi:hypothetical protein